MTVAAGDLGGVGQLIAVRVGEDAVEGLAHQKAPGRVVPPHEAVVVAGLLVDRRRLVGRRLGPLHGQGFRRGRIPVVVGDGDQERNGSSALGVGGGGILAHGDPVVAAQGDLPFVRRVGAGGSVGDDGAQRHHFLRPGVGRAGRDGNAQLAGIRCGFGGRFGGGLRCGGRVRLSSGGFLLFQLGNHRLPALCRVLVRVALGLRRAHIRNDVKGMQHPHPAQHVVKAAIRLCRVVPYLANQLLVKLVVVRGSLHFGQLGHHRVPALGPVLVGVALGLGGGHVRNYAEGLEHAHPAQHVVEAVARLRRIVPNLGDQLLIGLVVVLRPGGSGSDPDQGQAGQQQDAQRRQGQQRPLAPEQR